MEWRNVVGYEGIYEVSNTGLVRTCKNKTTHSVRHGSRIWKQRILKNKTPNGRNVRVTLWKDKRPRSFLVHRLVAEAFIPKVKGKESINHIDGNPKNNHVSNLEWCDHKENNNHGFDNDLMNTNDKIILLNKETKEPYYFRSKSKASEFLGKNIGYISGLTAKGKYETDEYVIFVSPAKNNTTGVIE